MNIGFDKAGGMLEERLAMVTPQQVKAVADNIEQITGNLRDVTAVLRDVALWLKGKITSPV